MALFLVLVSILSLIISKIALFVYLIASFRIELKRQTRDEKYTNREARKIKIPQKDQSQVKVEFKKAVLRINTLLWTMSIGEIVGYIFLILSQHNIKLMVLELNAIYLFVGALLCQILTVLNALFKKKMNLVIRIGFQIGFVLLGTLLLFVANSHRVSEINQFLLLIVLAYFLTAVVGIISMLIDALVAEQGSYDFDFNHYSRLVILLGLIIGSGIYFNFSLKIF